VKPFPFPPSVIISLFPPEEESSYFFFLFSSSSADDDGPLPPSPPGVASFRRCSIRFDVPLLRREYPSFPHHCIARGTLNTPFSFRECPLFSPFTRIGQGNPIFLHCCVPYFSGDAVLLFRQVHPPSRVLRLSSLRSRVDDRKLFLSRAPPSPFSTRLGSRRYRRF